MQAEYGSDLGSRPRSGATPASLPPLKPPRGLYNGPLAQPPLQTAGQKGGSRKPGAGGRENRASDSVAGLVSEARRWAREEEQRARNRGRGATVGPGAAAAPGVAGSRSGPGGRKESSVVPLPAFDEHASEFLRVKPQAAAVSRVRLGEHLGLEGGKIEVLYFFGSGRGWGRRLRTGH